MNSLPEILALREVASRVTLSPCRRTRVEVPKMTVGELIQKLQTLPRDATVKTWNANGDRETDEVHASVSDDGTVFVLETAIGREV